MVPNANAMHMQPLPVRAATHFFTHSGHVPLVLLILEALLARPGYFREADPYLLLGAGALQAWVSVAWSANRRWRVFAANISGPMVYTLAEALLEGGTFFHQWHHQAYWAFALAFALLQAIGPVRPLPTALVILAESITRSAIPIVMYAVFEARTEGAPLSLPHFFSDASHGYLTIVLMLLGALLGAAELNQRRLMATVASLSTRLRQYSEWSLGRDLLARAIADEQVLSLQRLDRAVLFMDIRGFTAWSERQPPEAVVHLLGGFYAAAESALAPAVPVKLKFTADEVMVVFDKSVDALDAGLRMLAATHEPLAAQGLSAGAGLNWGPVMEGVLGSEGAKAYDVIGDTVNAAQRLCDAAGGGELLASASACEAAGRGARHEREVAAKGKREPLLAGVFLPAVQPVTSA